MRILILSEFKGLVRNIEILSFLCIINGKLTNLEMYVEDAYYAVLH